MDERSITKKMLSKLRESRDEQARNASLLFEKDSTEDDNFLNRSKILMKEAVENNKKKTLKEDKDIDSHDKSFKINKDTPQFGDVRIAQEDAIRKCVNDNVQFDSGALRYYPDANDMTLDGNIPSLNLKFQFRYADANGSDGCYIWCDATVLSDENVRMIGKIKNAQKNWRDSITQDGDLLEKLKKASEND